MTGRRGFSRTSPRSKVFRSVSGRNSAARRVDLPGSTRSGCWHLCHDPELAYQVIGAGGSWEIPLEVRGGERAVAAVDPNRLNVLQLPMVQTPRNRVFYRPIHGVPFRPKRRRHPLPRKPLGPPSQKPAVRDRELVLAVAPGNLLHLHPTLGAVHPTHRIKEEDRDPPEGHVLELPLCQAIVARPDMAAARADGSPVLARLDLHFDRQTRRAPATALDCKQRT